MLVIDDPAQRDLFTPTPYLLLTRQADGTQDDYAIGSAADCLRKPCPGPVVGYALVVLKQIIVSQGKGANSNGCLSSHTMRQQWNLDQRPMAA
jgi:hypothetical protein